MTATDRIGLSKRCRSGFDAAMFEEVFVLSGLTNN
jgi:hypothetical protein